MVLSAEYIKKKLEQEMVLSQAFGRDLVRSFPCQEPWPLPACLPTGQQTGGRMGDWWPSPTGQTPTPSCDPWLPARSSLPSPSPHLWPFLLLYQLLWDTPAQPCPAVPTCFVPVIRGTRAAQAGAL